MAAFELDLNKDKGFELDLNKQFPSLDELLFEVSWKEHPVHAASLTDGYDLDLSAFGLDANGKIKVPGDVLFFNNKNIYNGAGVLPEDNRAGGVETMSFLLSQIPADRVQLDLFTTIFEAMKRKQTFLMMTDGKVRLINKKTGEVLVVLTLTDFTNDNALHVASLIRNATGWTFKVVGISASVESLNVILKNYF